MITNVAKYWETLPVNCNDNTGISTVEHNFKKRYKTRILKATLPKVQSRVCYKADAKIRQEKERRRTY